MSWQSIFISKIADNSEIMTALSIVFSVDKKNILVTSEYPIFAKLDPVLEKTLKIVCWTDIIGGEFPYRLEVFLLEGISFPKIKYETEAAICEILDCQGLVGDDELNPYSWMLIRKKGVYQQVQVDADKLDDKGEFHIADR